MGQQGYPGSSDDRPTGYHHTIIRKVSTILVVKTERSGISDLHASVSFLYIIPRTKRRVKTQPQHMKTATIAWANDACPCTLGFPQHTRLSCPMMHKLLHCHSCLSALRDTARRFTLPTLRNRCISTETVGSRLCQTAADVPTKAPQSTLFFAETVSRGILE
jgi:hypothetical protein